MHTMLVERWWALVLRGLAAILFGILTFIWPGVSLYTLVLLFGVWAVVNGGFIVAAGVRAARGEQRWGWLVFEGVASIAAGVLAFIWPDITALALLILIAAWALVSGVAEIATAIRLRKYIRGEWLLALTGVLSIAFGVLLLLFPASGALAVVLWIGAYAIVFGALMVALGFRLRSWRRDFERRVPSRGHPGAGLTGEPIGGRDQSRGTASIPSPSRANRTMRSRSRCCAGRELRPASSAACSMRSAQRRSLQMPTPTRRRDVLSAVSSPTSAPKLWHQSHIRLVPSSGATSRRKAIPRGLPVPGSWNTR